MTIREEVSKLVGLPIPKNGWDRIFYTLAVQGKMTQRLMQDLLVIICKKLEETETDEPSKKTVI